MKYFYIYEVKNNINGKTYIGQRTSKCLPELDKSYLGSGLIIQQAVNKYGKENFSKNILAIVGTRHNLNILEKVFISIYWEIGKAEYNITPGGHGGYSTKNNKHFSKLAKEHWHEWHPNHKSLGYNHSKKLKEDPDYAKFYGELLSKAQKKAQNREDVKKEEVRDKKRLLLQRNLKKKEVELLKIIGRIPSMQKKYQIL